MVRMKMMKRLSSLDSQIKHGNWDNLNVDLLLFLFKVKYNDLACGATNKQCLRRTAQCHLLYSELRFITEWIIYANLQDSDTTVCKNIIIRNTVKTRHLTPSSHFCDESSRLTRDRPISVDTYYFCFCLTGLSFQS